MHTLLMHWLFVEHAAPRARRAGATATTVMVHPLYPLLLLSVNARTSIALDVEEYLLGDVARSQHVAQRSSYYTSDHRTGSGSHVRGCGRQAGTVVWAQQRGSIGCFPIVQCRTIAGA
jgi:hypothetical protein